MNVKPGELDVDRFEELLASARAELGSDPHAAADKLRRRSGCGAGRRCPTSRTSSSRRPRSRASRSGAGSRSRLRSRPSWRSAGTPTWSPSSKSAVAEQPLREHLRGQLMLALYRCGRQADALEAYRAARRTLVEEVGVEPGAELRALQDAILAQAPENRPARGRGCRRRSTAARRCWRVAGPVGGADRAGRRDGRRTRRRRPRIRATGHRQDPPGRRVGPRIPPAADDRPYAGASTTPRRGALRVQRAEEGEAAGAPRAGRRGACGSRPAGAGRRRRCGRTAARCCCSSCTRAPCLRTSRTGEAVTRAGPLGGRAVADIARLYLPEGAEPTELRALAAETGGIPLEEIHRAAAAWAIAEAARVAEASAGRAATERGGCRPPRPTCPATCWRCGRSTSVAGATAASSTTRCSAVFYLGLASFDSAHAEYFFGRERLVAELVARLVGSPLLAVVGPSGARKSSATRRPAPALAGGDTPWLPALGPGADAPRPAPARWAGPGVARRASRGGACGGPVRGAVHGLPRRAGSAGSSAFWFHSLWTATVVQVVIAVRADFYGRIAAYERLARLVGANQVLVRPMRRDFAAPSWSRTPGSGCSGACPYGRADRGRGR